MPQLTETQSEDQQLLDKLRPSRIVLPVLIGLSVVGFMFWRSYKPGDLAPLANAKPLWLLLMLVVLVARDAGYVYRIRYLTQRVLSWRAALDVIMLWEFSSCVLPSAVGGTAVAPVLLHKEGIPLGKSVAYIMATAMLDNLYYVLAVPLVVLIGGDALYPHEALQGGLVATLRIGFILSYVFVTVYALLMLYAIFINPQSVKRLLVRLFSMRGLRRWRNKAYKMGNEMVLASGELRNNGRAYWLRAALSTAFVWTARYLVIGCLIAAFIDVSWPEFWLIFGRNLTYKVILLIAITPGGAGIAEGAFPTFFGKFIGTATMTNFMVLLYRIVTYYLYLVLGAVFLPRWVTRIYGKRKAEQVL
ncbi:lysylphosphatidylglycerol synthase transmembrane domain-containing protein [Hymenobacter yonginensis]|jgi:glycosyltransferase 2 family protein|uniref:Lysylphosphatidylglycerol synthase transmembrane domain-containing protein n=1 Tax=Hymenobacter yonginensis TaxID=748197 RepID=A0ABY7PN17_9BACT|nr:lysylphosphatidylglycerol synthase transmembrane domain-containing protein [Hymenobacter yonginensis]WBO84621.1 lysylphosphatidylglycerol synthase transmembrane domain-containing protein [Hymenobacter yonginensis]